MLVGIVLAYYNPNEKLFLEQLGSILNQTYQSWRLVISVDEDRNNFLRLNKKVQVLLHDPRVSIVINKGPRGFVQNFNHGSLALLKEDGIEAFVFCDQDDEWFPEKLCTQVEELKKKPRESLVFFDAVCRGAQEKELLGSLWLLEKRNVDNRDTESVLMRNVVSGAGAIFDRALAEDFLPIPDWVKFHDHYFAVCATTKGGIYPVDKPLYYYNQHSCNVVGGGNFKGVFNLSGQSFKRLRDKYEYLSKWKKRLGIKDNAIRNILRFDLLIHDPALYRSHLGYFIGKYFA